MENNEKPVAYAPIITFRESQFYQVSKQPTPEFCSPLYAAPVKTDLWNEMMRYREALGEARARIAKLEAYIVDKTIHA